MPLLHRSISRPNLRVEVVGSPKPIPAITVVNAIATTLERAMALRFSIDSIVNSKDNNDNTICVRKTPERGKDGATKGEQQQCSNSGSVGLVDEVKSPFDFSEGSSTSPLSTGKISSSSNGPQSQTLSFFDVALPHIQMASTNPFLMGLGPHGAASLQPGTSSEMTGAVISMHQQRLWLELLQHSGRSFAHTDHHHAGLFLQPFRKPKRIRTAFSPAQLLQLEHAFEHNHYVIGQERKELARQLQLTETQVKVWFQNRRTKHKRVKTEEQTKRQSKGEGDEVGGGSMEQMEEEEEEDEMDEDEVDGGELIG